MEGEEAGGGEGREEGVRWLGSKGGDEGKTKAGGV